MTEQPGPPRPRPATAANHDVLSDVLIERYQRESDPRDLDAIIAHLSAALSLGREDPARDDWGFWLGLSYAERGETRADYDRAVESFALSYQAARPGSVARGEAAVMLVEAYRDRYLFLRYGKECDDHTARRELDGLITAVEELDLSGAHDMTEYARMLIGLCRLERFSLSDIRADLDRGIALIDTALPSIDPDAPDREWAVTELVCALGLRGMSDRDLATLDLALAKGVAASAELEAGGPDWVVIQGYMSWIWAARGDVSKDVADITNAVTCAQNVLAAAPDREAEEGVARFTGMRALHTRQGQDLDSAIDLATRVLDTIGDQPSSASTWHELANLHHARTAVTGEDGLERALVCAETALARGDLDDDDLLQVHNTRLQIGADLLTRDEAGAGGYDRAQVRAAWLRRVLAEFHTALEQAVHADPDLRGHVALVLAATEMWLLHADFVPPDPVRVQGLLAMGAPIKDSEVQAVRRVLEGLLSYWNDSQRATPRGDHGVTSLAQAFASGDTGGISLDEARTILSAAVQMRGSRTGDVRSRSTAVGMFAMRTDDPGTRLMAEVMAAFEDLARDDEEAFLPRSDRIEAMFRALPDRSMDRAYFGPIVAAALRMAAVRRGHPEASIDIGTTLRIPGFFGLTQDFFDLLSRVMSAGATGDMALLRGCAAEAVQLCQRVPLHLDLHVVCAMLTGLTHLEIARRNPFDWQAAQQAVTYYTEAAAGAKRPEYPLWAMIMGSLADAMRRTEAPDHAASRAAARSALQGFAWQVAIQAGTEQGAQVARTASRDAIIIAGWCLRDGALDELVAVLDAGRGLVLSTAVLTRGIPERLEAAGHPELAAEWRATAGRGRDLLTGAALPPRSPRIAEREPDPSTGATGEPPTSMEVSDDLRPRVLRALADDRAATAQFQVAEPVTIAEVQASLRALDTDALVYLVPVAEGSPGYAVVVPATGQVEVVMMPGLDCGPGSVPHRFAGATGPARVAGPVGGRRRSVSLDAVCGWAWSVAVGRLVEHTGRWRLGRPARLALIPMGRLALVPWHAAYQEGTGVRRYAIADIQFSYTVSARMLQSSAGLPVRRVTAALVVGDPTGDLPGAGAEARAIRQRFYPDGSYFGQPAAGAAAPGRPDEVLDWVRRARSGPSALHFACHAEADPRRPAQSRLVLAGEEPLTAEALLEACRTAALDIDQVFLAACTTHSPGDDYDEAFSLATVFLSAGVHTVFGSLWAIPDNETSLLMYMLHHFLVVDGVAPAAALHRAQLWMVDPGRRAPAGMPNQLAVLTRGPGPADPIAWASFSHLGR